MAYSSASDVLWTDFCTRWSNGFSKHLGEYVDTNS